MQLLPEAIGVVRGEGSYLYLADGRKIFDGISSWWVTLHGHSHPRIAAAIAEQAQKLEQVIFAGFTHEPASVLAKKLSDRAPSGLAKVFYSDDGSTAVEVALKMAVQYWKNHGEDRTTFLALEGAYHGDTFGAMSASSRGAFTAPFGKMLFDVIRLPFPEPEKDDKKANDFSESEQKFLEVLRQNIRTNSGLAGFIYEPLLLGAGGMKLWRKEVLEESMRMCKEKNILCIADEVLTGFGRTGTFFASDSIQIAPDLMTLSKGLTGGFLPLGVTLASQKIYDSFLSDDRSKAFFHGHSFTGNPISCAASVASLKIFEDEPVMERVASIELVHTERMTRLASQLGYDVRVKGSLAVMEPKKSAGYFGGSPFALQRKCLSAGLLIRPLGDTIYLLPPYSTSIESLHHVYDALQDVISK